MRNRCGNPNNARYKRYGGRGIAVCREWDRDFVPFSQWAHKSGYRPGLTIERIDNDSGYRPDNCRWILRGEQQSNTRRSRKLTYKGETRTVAEWARRSELSEHAIRSRLKRGWSAEEAIETGRIKFGYYIQPRTYRIDRARKLLAPTRTP
jgi:hypothetical protein